MKQITYLKQTYKTDFDAITKITKIACFLCFTFKLMYHKILYLKALIKQDLGVQFYKSGCFNELHP